MDLRRGAFLVGTEVVKDFGAGDGIGRESFRSCARLTQKWMVVLGRGGEKDAPITARDQPAFQRERRRDSISTLVRVER